jgi:hypothetical protein
LAGRWGGRCAFGCVSRNRPVRLELARHVGGTAADVPAAVARFLAATTEYYYSESSLDNVVVVQGNLFEAAVPLVSVLCAALTEDLPDAARREAVRLIAEIVNGDVHQSEVAAGRADLAENGLSCSWHRRNTD